MNDQEMSVIKRNGSKEDISFDKILKRIKKIGERNHIQSVNYTALCLKVIDQLYDEIETKKIDELTAQQCASMITIHPDYGKLASCICISNHQKNTDDNFTVVISRLYDYFDIHGNHHQEI